MLKLQNKPWKKQGFLLLEVLVSVVIISVGLIFIVRSFSSATRAVDISGRYLKLASLIEQKLWDLEAKGSIAKGTYKGDFKDEQAYKWEYKADALKDFPINTVMLMVKKPVLHKKKAEKISVETYLWNEED